MRATGIVRDVDNLGRIVIPKSMRETMLIKEGDPLELFVDGEFICLKKHNMIENINADIDRIADCIVKKYGYDKGQEVMGKFNEIKYLLRIRRESI